MSKIYDFKTQLDRGKSAELEVVNYLQANKNFVVEEAKDMLFQRKGIDYFITLPNDIKVSAEIKADFRSFETNNVFLETVSVEKYDVIENYGWLYTSTAQILIYYNVGAKEIYFINMLELKNYLSTLKNRYKEVVIRNKTYVGRGLVMPLKDFRDYVFLTYKMEEN